MLTRSKGKSHHVEEITSSSVPRPLDSDKSSSTQRSHSRKQGTKKGPSKRTANEIEADAAVISSSRRHSFSISIAASVEQPSAPSHAAELSSSANLATADEPAGETGQEKLSLTVKCENPAAAVAPCMSPGQASAFGLSTKRIKISDVSMTPVH